MKFPISIFAAGLGVLCGCGKIKKLGGDAGALRIDAAYENLVKHEGGGVVFRKDLAFPENLRVETKREVSGSWTGVSEARQLGLGGGEDKSLAETTVTTVARDGDQARYILSVFPIAGTEPHQGKKDAAPVRPESITTLDFQRKGESWQAENSSDFRAKTLALDLQREFDKELIAQGAAPRKMWFSSVPMVRGAKLELKDSAIALLDPRFSGKGSVTLEWIGTEPVQGHPCGVFQVKGTMHEKKRTAEEFHTSIETGKMWFSLIYPLVLREETESVVTWKTPRETRHGKIKSVILRKWQPAILNP